jgi:penicillin-binding protein 2
MPAEVAPSAGPPAPTPQRESTPEFAPRFRFIQRAVPALLVVLVASLAYWQLGRSADYAARERRQSQRRIMVPAPRGVIYDREHRVLAGNRTRIAAVLHLGELRAEFLKEQRSILLRDKTTDGIPIGEVRAEVDARARLAVVQRHLDRVNALIGRRERLDASRLERAFAQERMVPFVLADDLSAEESARLAAKFEPSDPVQQNRSTQRWYPQGSAAAHVLGRVRREMIRTATGRDFATMNFIGAVGESGIEKQYDSRLQGHAGDAVIRVDAWGFPVDPALEHRDPAPGEDLVLSLDIDLQLAAERAMAATPGVPRGAAVAIAVATGEVLALANKPDFDLNTVSPTLTSKAKQRIDSEGGWLNRATQGLYPPGSTFKIFTTLAGLRGGTLHPTDVFHCDGFLEVAGRRFLCHHASGHGDLSLREALAHSCNVFAYQTGLAAGPDALVAEARRFHFDEPTGIDLPFETRQMLVPDPAGKSMSDRGDWTAIDTANLSIGQGFLRYSPLQAACAIASLARRETRTVPTLLFQPGRHPSGNRPPEPLGLAESDYAALIEGLQAVVRTGIGQDAQVPGVSLAGKSGTAQVMRKEGMMNVAWFVAFAPADKPEIAIAVAMEGDQPGTEFAGAEHAAPIVREIAGAYFDKRAKH